MQLNAPQSQEAPDFALLARDIKRWGADFGFQQVGIADCELGAAEARLLAWLDRGWHGDMDYMARHGTQRSRPAALVPGTLRVISARMNYFPADASPAVDVLGSPGRAYLSRYALGRDYHKVMRRRLQRLADRISGEVGVFNYRAFTDSAPVMEVALAEKAGIGWRGKHTLLLNREAGSYFFLGEIYTDLPLPADTAVEDHCGTCVKCIRACPTGAIVAPYELDARRCISYLTIEHKSAIPPALRSSIGNRVYGCDDCQIACPGIDSPKRAPNLILQYAKGSTTRRSSIFSHGRNRNSTSAWQAAPFIGSVTNAGCAIWRSAWETLWRSLAIQLKLGPSPPPSSGGDARLRTW
jgi:epoxyqueuosine reductase